MPVVVMVVVSSVVVMVVMPVVPMVVMAGLGMVVVSSTFVVVDRRFFYSTHYGRYGSYDRGGNDIGEECSVNGEKYARDDDRLHVRGEIRESLRSSEKRHERRRFF